MLKVLHHRNLVVSQVQTLHLHQTLEMLDFGYLVAI
jgi:hypothetical protein